MSVRRRPSPLNDVAAPDAAPARPFQRDDFDRDVWSLLGLPVDLETAPEALAMIEQAVRDRRRLSFATPNVNFLIRALSDSAARDQLIDTDLNIVDGAPLVALGRLLGAPVKERCAGSDLFEALRRRPGIPGRRMKVFFFGGRAGAGEAAAAAINAEGRGVEAAGFFNPGDGDLASMSADAVIDRINAADADFILVALGAAKGQAWIDLNRHRLSAPVISHLGAVIDFTAGSIKRAPSFARRLGFEWAWRIKEEPSLWRRYWSDGVALATIVAARLAAAMTSAGAPVGRAASCVLIRSGGGVAIRLDGDLASPGLDPVRRAFREAAAEGRDVELDLERAGRIDAAFLGLVLMLEKNLRARRLAIALANASAAHRRLFAAHSMNYAPAAVGATERAATERGIAAAV